MRSISRSGPATIAQLACAARGVEGPSFVEERSHVESNVVNFWDRAAGAIASACDLRLVVCTVVLARREAPDTGNNKRP